MFKVKHKQLSLPVMILLIISICIGTLFLGGCNDPRVDPVAVQGEESPIITSKAAASPERIPANLTVDLYLTTAISNNSLTRYIGFYNPSTNSSIQVPIEFMRKTSTHFIGSAYKADPNITKLKSLSNFNNRKYWDQMKFENLYGSLALNIQSCEVRIWYSAAAKQNDPVTNIKNPDYSFDPLIARKFNFALGAKGSKVDFNNFLGRSRHVYDFHKHFQDNGWTILSYNSSKKPARLMIEDIGKSGTDLGDQKLHVKYGTIDINQAGCNEAIEWYYHELRNNYSWYNNEFLHQSGPKTMAKVFLEKERLYVWDKYNHVFKLLKKNSSSVWYRTKGTHTPQSGDYIVRFNKSPRDTTFGDDVKGEHAMMILSFMKKGDSYRMNVLEMWDPVKIRNRVIDLSVDGHRYCVGKMD